MESAYVRDTNTAWYNIGNQDYYFPCSHFTFRNKITQKHKKISLDVLCYRMYEPAKHNGNFLKVLVWGITPEKWFASLNSEYIYICIA